MLSKLSNYLELVAAYAKLNLCAHLEYRGAFFSQVAAMFFNNCFWLAFWFIFFTRFPVLRGWSLQDVVTLWAVAAAGFGLGYSFFGNCGNLATLIVKGQLDTWMLYPRGLLSHLLLGRMSPTAWGDTIFGYAAYLLLVRPDLAHFLLFALLTVSAGILYVGFSVVAGSLGFYMGNAEGLAEQWRFSLITFSTYPFTLFEGLTRIVLFTVIPAGFISCLPILSLRQLSLSLAGLSLLGSLAVLLLGTLIFYHGLARYESGNLMEMRE